MDRVAGTTNQRVVALLVGLPQDTRRLEDVDQAALGGVVIGVIVDISGSGTGNHGVVVGLESVGGAY